ncbi:hypothetical protein O0I10_002464 [Lichtheimia ornata]|uniref:Uncharacterized protein n=1 Tax=Lichtheimia ornata TaxID=688661 RepID=A0AAD7Y2P2_9FUNG|nr:uncharacterized protein O0I10_002464 [Lichtheimia ornata]KAJ8661657.1 hypothetical protein O0I10_002464 [Lichtheimia ornata]
MDDAIPAIKYAAILVDSVAPPSKDDFHAMLTGSIRYGVYVGGPYDLVERKYRVAIDESLIECGCTDKQECKRKLKDEMENRWDLE